MEKLRTLELNVVWLVVDTYDEPVGPDCSATPDDEAVLLVRSEPGGVEVSEDMGGIVVESVLQ